MWRLFAIVLLGFWVALAGAADGLVPLPDLKARVTDLTGTLSSEQRQQLELRLAEFETRKGSQIAAVLLPTTQPESIEQFSIRLAEVWKIGRKDVDDGVIVVVAKGDRALRIEVGYGLEGALNDATAKRIVSEIMVPALKQGDFFAALDKGVAAIIAVVDGEPLPARDAHPASAAGGAATGILGDLSFDGLLFILGNAAILGAVLRHFLGNLLGCGLVGIALGAIGWVVAGITGVVIGFIAGSVIAQFGFSLLQIMGSARGGGYGNGGSGGSSGGWSGGGGGFGGGGASGSW